MNTYLVTMLCEVSVEAFNESDAECRAAEEVMDCVNWYEIKGIECYDDEDE